jgi:uncharacterized membrane protein
MIAHIQADQVWFILLIVISCTLVLIGVILGFWFYTAMVAIIVEETLGVIEAFRKGWKYLWPMAWVVTIYSGIITTGILLGLLPGILCLVWFAFSFYILLEEDQRGMDAILISMEYVRGNWWNTFGKLLVVWLLYIIIAAIPFVGTIASIFFHPFVMLFTVELYRDLKSNKGEVELSTSTGAKIFWWIVTVIGLALPVIVLIGALMAIIQGDNFWFEQFSYSYRSGHSI